MAYVYQPYPRWMTHIDGARKVVNSEAEEKALGEDWFATKDEADDAKAKAEPPTPTKTDPPPPTQKADAGKNALLSGAAKV